MESAILSLMTTKLSRPLDLGSVWDVAWDSV